MKIAVNTTAFPVLPVTLAISPNKLNPDNAAKTQVFIVTTSSFDAATVDSSTVRFGATGTEAAPVDHPATDLKDIDKDGDLDLSVSFINQDMGIQCGDTMAFLSGQTKAGWPIEGHVSILPSGCKGD